MRPRDPSGGGYLTLTAGYELTNIETHDEMLYLPALMGVHHLLMRVAIRAIRPLIWAVALAATTWLLGGCAP